MGPLIDFACLLVLTFSDWPFCFVFIVPGGTRRGQAEGGHFMSPQGCWRPPDEGRVGPLIDFVCLLVSISSVFFSSCPVLPFRLCCLVSVSLSILCLFVLALLCLFFFLPYLLFCCASLSLSLSVCLSLSLSLSWSG